MRKLCDILKVKKITSAQNPQIKNVLKLRNRRARDETKTFLIEGYRELLRAFDAKVVIEKLFFSPEHFLKDNEEPLIKRIAKSDSELFELSKSLFEKVSYRDRPDGLLAIAKQGRKTLSSLPKIIKGKKNPFLLVAESIEKPGNLGTILRSSDAAGVDAVIVCDACTDIYNPNVVRASIGTLFTQPVIECQSQELLNFLQDAKIEILSATPHSSTVYTDVDLTKAVAIVVGCEQYGLTELWMKQCSHQVKIPMLGIADSLNVATATTLLLYEVVRQRKLS
ncbi:MAG: RNA methyltransferase [Chlamydiae bacterium CG10_big_fil_rev_8_21_14_0_10_35_9]|nr:MAG: RNA methyltransferase [Chlamydiae bacterium CG10_big_fil_rev_8_21_14_0_10_35_9]